MEAIVPNSSSKSDEYQAWAARAAGSAVTEAQLAMTNVSNIMTVGADAYGIFAQSVGGGGGSGGNAHSSTDDLIPVSIPGINIQIKQTAIYRCRCNIRW